MQNRDSMHPQDIRNLIIFAVISIGMWLAYDHFIAKPHAEQMRRAAVVAEQAAIAGAPREVTDTMTIKPRPDIIAETPRVKIDTKTLYGSINLKGGRLDDVELRDYYKTIEKKENVSILSPARTPHPRYVETGWLVSGSLSAPDGDTVWKLKPGSAETLTPATPVTITATLQGVTYERTFSVDEEFGFSLENKIVNKSGHDIKVHPYALATEHGMPEDFQNMGSVHEGPIAFANDELHERTYKSFKKNPEEKFAANGGWIGLTTKYWLTAIVPADQSGQENIRFISSPSIGDKTKDRYQVDLTGAEKSLSSGSETSYKINVFAGAKKVKLLEEYGVKWNAPRFDKAVDFGMLYFLTKPFFLAINFLYSLTGNFGLAIILFTCVLRILVFPLANTSYKSFAKLRMVSPEMYNLRHQYKDDKVKLQQELVALYQKHNVNPAAGCLPIIVQIPIFFALYKVLSNTIEMRHAPFFGWIHDLSAMDPTTIFNLFGLIPWAPPSFLMIGAWPILMMIAMIVQKNISPPPDDPIQARMLALMPYFMTFIMAKFASGLVIYWTVNNCLAIIQQVIIMRMMGVPVHLFSKDQDKEKLEKEIDQGPMVVTPKLEMIEEELEEAIAGEPKPVSKPKPKKKKKK